MVAGVAEICLEHEANPGNRSVQKAANCQLHFCVTESQVLQDVSTDHISSIYHSVQRAIKDVAIQNEQALYKQCVDQPTAVRAERGCFQQTNATKSGGCNTDRRHYNAPQSRRKQLRDSSTSLHARKLANHTCTTSPPRTPLQFVVWRCTGKGQRLVLADQSQLMTSRNLERC